MVLDQRRRRVAAFAYWTAVLTAVALGAVPLIPPAPSGDADETSFSARRAFRNIEVLAQEPRPIGSAANKRARVEIAAQLDELGLHPVLQFSRAPDYYGGSDRNVEIVNVLARVPGTATSGAVAVVGHYDTVPGSPGANDDASGVAVMLETARVLLANGELENDVIFVFTDGEEPAPRFGSTAFVEKHRWARDVRFVINLEAIGTAGPSMLIEIEGPQDWVLDHYAAVPHPAAFSYLTALTELIGGSNTDFAPFRDRGIAGVEFAYAHGSSIYHTDADAADRVSLRSLQQHGENTLAIVEAVGDSDLTAIEGASNTVFFTVGRGHLVRYPEVAGWAAVVVAGVALGAVVSRSRRWRRVARSGAATVGVVTGSALTAGIAWTILATWRDTMGMVESYVYLLVAAALIVAATFRWARATTAGVEAAGVVLVWWVIGAIAMVLGPGLGYVFTWPALIGAVVLLSRSNESSTHWMRAMVGLVVVAPAVVLAVPMIDTLYQFAQPRPGNTDSQILFAVALPVALLVLVTQLAWAFRPDGSRSGDQPAAGDPSVERAAASQFETT